MNIFKKSVIGLGLSLSLATVNFAHANLAIIVNPDYSGSEISIEQVRALYLGKSKTLPDGTRAKAVDQASDSSARAEFLSSVLEQTESALNRTWSKLIFSGRGRPPEVLDSADAIKRWIALNPEGIGYIDAGDVDSTVKVLLKVTQ
ncbi:MAG: phosphate ABC transporter substrate-binding protein [Porticoccaceae bacterium]